MKNNLELPKDGLTGLKENFASDAASGFIVFLLALPLSLGIAKASDFPPIMGLLTAIIGGIVVSFHLETFCKLLQAESHELKAIYKFQVAY